MAQNVKSRTKTEAVSFCVKLSLLAIQFLSFILLSVSLILTTSTAPGVALIDTVCAEWEDLGERCNAHQKRHVGVDSKDKGSWGQTTGPARRAGRQASRAERCSESKDCTQRAKTQTALPSSGPSFALQAASLHSFTGTPPPQDRLSSPWLSSLLFLSLSLTPYTEQNKVPRSPSSSFLFFLSFFLPRRRVASHLLSLTPRLRSGHYTAEMVCSC